MANRSTAKLLDGKPSGIETKPIFRKWHATNFFLTNQRWWFRCDVKLRLVLSTLMAFTNDKFAYAKVAALFVINSARGLPLCVEVCAFAVQQGTVS